MLIINIAIILLIIVLVSLPLIGIHLEKKGYNNGRCPKCSISLRHFDTDSQGGRGYCCPNCHYATWVSYKIVDKNYNEWGRSDGYIAENVEYDESWGEAMEE